MQPATRRKRTCVSALVFILILSCLVGFVATTHPGSSFMGKLSVSSATPSAKTLVTSPTSVGTPSSNHSPSISPSPTTSDFPTRPSLIVPFYSLPAIVTGHVSSSGLTDGSGYYSANWGGDFRCQLMHSGVCVDPGSGNEIMGVEGGWIVASIASTSSSTEYASTWVGIGGWGSGDLIQAGTTAAIASGGSTAYWTWWEMLPAASQEVMLSPDSTISPGDQMFVSVIYQGTSSSGQVWQFVLEDLTTGSSWQADETCGSSCAQSTFSTADWIQESPEVGSTIVQIPVFSSFPFIDPEYYTGDTDWSWNSNVNWVWQQNTAYTPAVTVVPSSLYSDPDMFYIDYLADSQRQTTSCCGVSQSSAEPTQEIQASDSLSSPDSFRSDQAQNLGLEVALVSSDGTIVESDATDASVGFSVDSGQNSYDASLIVNQGIPYGTYDLELGLWYVPLDGSIGGSGSLLLQVSGGVSYGPTIEIFGPSVSAPVASPASGQVDAGQNASLTTTATGGSGGYSYTWTGIPMACPNSDSTWISCHGLARGNYSISVTVTDSVGAEYTSSSLSFVVNSDPAVSGIHVSPPSADAGQSVTFTAGVSGGTGTYTFAWSGLPASACTGTGTSTVTCSALSEQSLTLKVTATDTAGMKATGQPLAYSVLSDPAVGTPISSPVTVDVGQVVAFATTVSGGSGGYRFSWTNLPTGCISDNSSSLSCIPTGSGSFTPTVAVTDSNSYTVTATATYLVSPLPTVESPSATATTILQGNSVTFTVTASQGSGGLTYAWNGLPPGCISADNPMIACTPSAAGTWNVSVTVTDSNGGTATSGGLSVTVQPSFLGLPALEGYLLVIGVPIVAAVAILLVLLTRRRRKRRTDSRQTGGTGEAVSPSTSPDPTANRANSAVAAGGGAVAGVGSPAEGAVAPVWFEQSGSKIDGLDPGLASMSTPLIDPPDPVCWHCQHRNPPGSRYCASCALPLEPPPSAVSIQQPPRVRRKRSATRS